MENKNFFTDTNKSQTMPRENEKNMTSEYIDMFLNGILLKQEKQRLKSAIDQALDKADRESFLKLSTKLNQLEESLDMK
ncbi:MAG TPA: IDEAL domain-containing protein [Chondromyces sp.]|nr:IDEAL domain-containing protein [Chondromyces sp.]